MTVLFHIGRLSFWTYHETGMALHYNTKQEAELLADLLRGKDSTR